MRDNPPLHLVLGILMLAGAGLWGAMTAEPLPPSPMAGLATGIRTDVPAEARSEPYAALTGMEWLGILNTGE